MRISNLCARFATGFFFALLLARQPLLAAEPQTTSDRSDVLLIGDSISLGYTPHVVQLLQDTADVRHHKGNAQHTGTGLKKLDDWLGDTSWDVIHFNWGLHDLKYLGPQGKKLASPESADSRQQVPIETYEANLRKLVARLRETEAKLVWRSTTPVPKGAAGRVSGDAVRYNAVARKIMDEYDIASDDQYAFALPRLSKIQKPANVHFTAEGSRQLAKQAVAAIEQALAD